MTLLEAAGAPASGATTASVAWVRVVPGAAEMDNLTVAQDHTYAVGTSRAVVHNTEEPCENVEAPKLPKYTVGKYSDLQGQAEGLDAHHVGQGAAIRRLVPGYVYEDAPAILVPREGHIIRVDPDTWVVSRNTRGFTNARQVAARDIWELRCVYPDPDIPNSTLQALIDLNENTYPGALSNPSRRSEMDPKDFVARIHSLVIDEYVDLWRQRFASADEKGAKSEMTKRLYAIANMTPSDEYKQVLLWLIRLTAVDVVSHVFGIVDGSSTFIARSGAEFQLIELKSGVRLDGQLQDMFLEQEENSHQAD